MGEFFNFLKILLPSAIWQKNQVGKMSVIDLLTRYSCSVCMTCFCLVSSRKSILVILIVLYGGFIVQPTSTRPSITRIDPTLTKYLHLPLTLSLLTTIKYHKKTVASPLLEIFYCSSFYPKQHKIFH